VNPLLSHPVIVTIAVLGGAASVLAIVLRMRGKASPEWPVRLDRLSYVLMGISIVLFIVSGFVNRAP
jgi:hypothetical protein